MLEMRGTVRNYDWGSATAIPSLLGVEPDGRPWAEVWYGDLPTAPMSVAAGFDQWVERSGGELPYLAKLLAASQPLSLQTHPDAALAAAGFNRQNAAGIDLDAPERIYRDPFAKPEIMIAIAPFEALCGFRPVDATIELLTALGATALSKRLADEGLQATFEHLVRSPADSTVINLCSQYAGASECPEAGWVAELARLYPGDPSVVATLLLNYVALSFGEAIYLDAGNVHAYLRGVGIEVMGPSDNVIRCGLTPKHVDIDEMMSVVRFEPLAEPRAPISGDRYMTPGAPFVVQRSPDLLWLGEEDPATTTSRAFNANFIPPDQMRFAVAGVAFTVSPSKV